MCSRQFSQVFAVLCIFSLSLCTLGAGPAPAKIKWYKDLKSAHKVAAESEKPVLIVFGASWCGFCHKLERETLTDQKLVQLVEKEFVAVHLDFDRDEKIAKILDVEKLPCTVILSPEADLLAHEVGFNKPKQYTQILTTALERRAEIQQAKHAAAR